MFLDFEMDSPDPPAAAKETEQPNQPAPQPNYFGWFKSTFSQSAEVR